MVGHATFLVYIEVVKLATLTAQHNDIDVFRIRFLSRKIQIFISCKNLLFFSSSLLYIHRTYVFEIVFNFICIVVFNASCGSFNLTGSC